MTTCHIIFLKMYYFENLVGLFQIKCLPLPAYLEKQKYNNKFN